MTMSRKQKKNLIRIIVSLLLLAAAWIVTATLLPNLGIWNLLIFAVPYLVAAMTCFFPPDGIFCTARFSMKSS